MDTFFMLGIASLAALLIILMLVVIWIFRSVNSKIDAVNTKLIEAKVMQSQTTQAFGHIQSSIGRLTKAGEQMERLGLEISELSDIFKSPKIRGGIGELLLNDLLGQILSPEHYQIQYTFKSGERVDAVINLKAGKVPVDAKFPLESFQRKIAAEEQYSERLKREFTRTVKGHINDIASKYILPDEGTFDFALMYIPAENVYYETIIKDERLGNDADLLTYAIEKHVIPVSPNSFYAYLQAIALGLKGLQIEKQAHQIMKYLSRIEGDFKFFKEEFSILGGHLERAKKKYDDTSISLERFGDKLNVAGEPSSHLLSEDSEKIQIPDSGNQATEKRDHQN